MFSEVEHSPHATLLDDRSSVTMSSWGSALLDYPIMKPGSGIHVFRFKVLKVGPCAPPALPTVTMCLTRWLLSALQRAPRGGVCFGVCNQLFNARQKNVGAAANSWGYSSSGKKVGGSGWTMRWASLRCATPPIAGTLACVTVAVAAPLVCRARASRVSSRTAPHSRLATPSR